MPRVRKGDVVWVEPELVAQVEFSEWTHDRRLRQPSYQGLREDKSADEVGQDDAPGGIRPVPPELGAGTACSGSRTSTSRSGPTKASRRATCSRTTARSRRRVLPHIRDRPFTMRRYPDGWQGKAFFQKDKPKGMPAWIPTAGCSSPRASRRRAGSGSTPRS